MSGADDSPNVGADRSSADSGDLAQPKGDDAAAQAAPEPAAPPEDPVVVERRLREELLQKKRRITEATLTLQRKIGWMVKEESLGGAKLEIVSVEGASRKACRVTTDVKCSLETFETFLADQDLPLKFEPNMESNELLQVEAEGIILRTAYKSTGFGVAARDFVAECAIHDIPNEEARMLVPLYKTKNERIVRCLVSGAMSCDAVAVHPKYTRGHIYAFGYIAAQIERQQTAASASVSPDRDQLATTAPMRSLTRIVTISHVDPKGSLLGFAYEATFPDIARRMLKVRDYLEAEETTKVEESKRKASAQTGDSDGTATATTTGNSTTTTRASLPPPGTVKKRKSGVPRERRAILDAVVRLHRRTDWRLSRTLEDCLLEDVSVSYSTKKAQRISTDVQCDLATFAHVVSSDEWSRRVEGENLSAYEVLPAPTAAAGTCFKIIYTRYKSQTRLVTPRDYCIISTSACAFAHDPLCDNFPKKGYTFIFGATNATAKPIEKEFTRGHVHAYGFVACAETEESRRITVHHLVCIDPSGGIPAWVVDAAAVESCKKLARIRKVCEERFVGTLNKSIAPPAKLSFFDVPEPTYEAIREASVELPPIEGNAATAEIAAPKATTGTAVESNSVVSTNDEESSKEPPKDPQESSYRDPTANENLMDRRDRKDKQTSEEDDTPPEVVQPDIFDEETRRISSFHHDEVTHVCGYLTELFRSRAWDQPRLISECRLQMLSNTVCPTKAVKIFLEIQCTLECFRAVIQDVNNVRALDPTVEKVAFLQGPPYGSVVYTSYKSTSSFFSSRDFCTLTAGRILSEDEGADLGLYTQGIHAAAYIQNSINSTDMPPQNNYTRGEIHAYGYIAVATPPEARRIRVFHLAHVDPKGKVPARLVDTAYEDSCKKMLALRKLCEVAQKNRDQGESAKVAALNAASDSLVPIETIRAHEEPLIELQRARGWTQPQQIGKCRVEELAATADPKRVGRTRRVLRASTEIMCSLSTFASFMRAQQNVRRFIPDLDNINVSDTSGGDAIALFHATEQHSKNSSRFPNREFCLTTTLRTFTNDEGADAGLFTSGIKSTAFVLCARDADQPHTPKQVGKGYVRGSVFVRGYIAIATPPDAKRVRVAYITCVDPKGGDGDKLEKNAPTHIANELTRLSVLCQAHQIDLDEALRQGEAAADDAQPTEHHKEVPITNTSTVHSTANSSGNLVPTTTASAVDQQQRQPPQASQPTPEHAAKSPQESANHAPKQQTAVPQTSDATAKPTPAVAVVASKQAPEATKEEDAQICTTGIAEGQLPMLNLLLELQRRVDWKRVKVEQQCLLEDLKTPLSEKKAQRISSDFQCTLSTFAAFIQDVNMVREYDPTLDVLEVLRQDRIPATAQAPSYTVAVVYSAYKSGTRLMKPRDFCSASTSAFLSPDETTNQGIQESTTPQSAFIQNAIHSDLKPDTRGYIRGKIITFGYIAIGQVNKTGIKVYNIACVDPSGSIPNWIVDAAAVESCRKLAKIRGLCEALQQKRK